MALPELCALCRLRPSSPTAEHAWPSWFLEMFSPEEGPYKRSVGGSIEKKRDCVTDRTQTSMERVKLPCCVPCNAILAQRFEGPRTRAIVRRFMAAEGYVELSAAESEVLGLWLLKTLLLVSHRLARGSYCGTQPERWDDAPDDIYDWTVNGHPPPDGLTVWASRKGDAENENFPSRRIPLPTVVAADHTLVFQVFQCRVGFLDLTLVYHPGWPIAHPLEAEHRAVRLWPPRVAATDFTALPPVHDREIIWNQGPELRFAPGMYTTETLPPLGPDWDPMFSPPPGVIAGAN